MTTLAFITAALVSTLADNPACALALAEVARVAAERGWQAEARCVGGGGRKVFETASLQIQRVAPDAVLRSGLMTLVAHAEDPGHKDAHRVSVRVAWVAPAWIAARARRVGESLLPEDVKLAPHRWADGVAVQPAEEAAPQGRLRRALRAGDVLTADALASGQALLRGDRVSAVLAAGGIEVRLPASLLAPARVGDRVRVQPLGRNATLEGVLVDPQSVQVEGS